MVGEEKPDENGRTDKDYILITRRDYTNDSSDALIWSIDISGSSYQYNRDGEWEFNRMPSSRDDDYYKRLRYTYEEAVAIARTLVKDES